MRTTLLPLFAEVIGRKKSAEDLKAPYKFKMQIIGSLDTHFPLTTVSQIYISWLAVAHNQRFIYFATLSVVFSGLNPSKAREIFHLRKGSLEPAVIDAHPETIADTAKKIARLGLDNSLTLCQGA